MPRQQQTDKTTMAKKWPVAALAHALRSPEDEDWLFISWRFADEVEHMLLKN